MNCLEVKPSSMYDPFKQVDSLFKNIFFYLSALITQSININFKLTKSIKYWLLKDFEEIFRFFIDSKTIEMIEFLQVNIN